ncbi:hypothetical protein [Mycobacterium sp. 1274761.0]|uniref:hypothetical protein n=1 Tax=Mycobacterium sp. 1274761.0 TaxID=1834077 RepID=UPI0007FF404E|nr:hypothetical protein [Mycobacterium sp. 1274761.0]OBK78233.1 hypothetical protein A5651_03230 [Mycobacterium sp. 1274761.0]
MFIETQWDCEVDVVCIGAEAGVLAAALVADNADLDVYLGITEALADGADLAASVGYPGGDGQTTKHLAGFAYAFDGADRASGRCPVRAAEDAPRPQRRGAIEPFFGAALEQWAHQCAAAPHSLVYNRVTHRQMVRMRCTNSSEKVEAAVVGAVTLSPDLPALSLDAWLRFQAAEAELPADTGVRLARLVFEDNGVAGALIETQDGVLAVRARENLIIAVGDPQIVRPYPLISATETVTARVSLVSKAASRFGEIEIVTAPGDDERLLFVDAPEPELQLASGL